jgi:hypothetical protein
MRGGRTGRYALTPAQGLERGRDGVPACCCSCRLAGAGSSSHSGMELWRGRTGKGSSGGRKKGVV